MKLSERMGRIAERIDRLEPCRRHPERFHEELDDIKREMQAIAANLGAIKADELRRPSQSR